MGPTISLQETLYSKDQLAEQTFRILVVISIYYCE